MKKQILIKQIKEIRKSNFLKNKQDIFEKTDFLSIEKAHAGTRESADSCTQLYSYKTIYIKGLASFMPLAIQTINDTKTYH